MYILGIDFGTKKLGLAVLESTSGVVSPLPIQKNDQYLDSHIAKLITEYRITTVVMGLPSYENTHKKVKRFAHELEQKHHVHIFYTSEDNTSLVTKKLLETKKQKSQLDSMSATEILTQWYTDTLKSNKIRN